SGLAARAGCSVDRVTVEVADLASLASVENFCASYLTSGRSATLLVLNAGVYPTGDEGPTIDGHDIAWQVNFLSHFVIVRRLLPLVKKAASDYPYVARVIAVTSEMSFVAGAGDLPGSAAEGGAGAAAGAGPDDT